MVASAKISMNEVTQAHEYVVPTKLMIKFRVKQLLRALIFALAGFSVLVALVTCTIETANPESVFYTTAFGSSWLQFCNEFYGSMQTDLHRAPNWAKAIMLFGVSLPLFALSIRALSYDINMIKNKVMSRRQVMD